MCNYVQILENWLIHYTTLDKETWQHCDPSSKDANHWYCGRLLIEYTNTEILAVYESAR